MPGGLPGPGQQEVQARAMKAVGESWRHPWGALGGSKREKKAEGSRLGRARLGLHVEHVGRTLVVPVPEACIAWAL